MSPTRIAIPSLLLTLLAACGGAGDQPSVTPSAEAASVTSAGTRGKRAEAVEHVFVGKFAAFTVVRSGGNVVVTNKGTGAATQVEQNAKLYFDDLTIALDKAGVAAQAFRLYQAAFDRVPDSSGLGFHISVMEGAGISLTQVAQGFVDSAEFKSRYGSLDNAAFLTQLYQNILHRAPDPAGLAYWLALLDGKALSRGQALVGFADSPENVLLVAPAIENGIAYIPYISGGAATASTVGEAEVPWNLEVPVTIVLRDKHGQAVPSASVTCSVTGPVVLNIDADCRKVDSTRLGEQDIIVKGSGLSATLRLKVIPQRKPFGTAGNSNHYNLMATTAGNVLGWGTNYSGVLGQGAPHVEHYNLPVMVKNAAGAAPLTGVAATTAGELDAMALLTSGEVVAWTVGETFARAEVVKGLPRPVRNAANNGNLQNIVQLQVGKDNAVALTATGRVMTWGSYHGQGVSGTANFPNEVKDPSGNGPLTGIVAIAGGGNFGLALSDSGKVYGWGWNSAGQTGRGTVDNPVQLPAPVLAEDGTELTNIVAISAGYHFSLALTADGRVYGWGTNEYGQLGQNATSNYKTRAVLVKDSAGTGILNNIAMISAGGHHSLALDTSGRVLSWGREDDAALGEGANRARVGEYRPMYVVSPEGTGILDNVVTIAASYENSQALRKDGTVLVWGNGFYGNLGQGFFSNDEVAVPRVVKNLAGTGNLVLPVAGYHNLLNRGR